MEGSEFLPAHLPYLVLIARKEIDKKCLIIILDTQDQYPKITKVELVEFCKCKLKSNLLRNTACYMANRFEMSTDFTDWA